MKVVQVAIGIVVRQDRVLICQRLKQSVLGDLWEFPGGKLEPGECPIDCLRRELREEVALEVEVSRVLTPHPHTYPHAQVLIHPFLCQHLTGEPRANAAQQVRWVPLAELPRYHFPDANAPLLRELLSIYPEPAGTSPFTEHRIDLSPDGTGEVRRFGTPVPGSVYTDRPGVYAVIRDTAGRIAVVRAGTGTGVGYYLPGGGVDPGESPEQTLSRECREECGQSAQLLRPVGNAIQYVTTASGRRFAKRCAYYQGRFLPHTECPPTEADHQLLWFDPEEAIDRLALESDAWAVRQVVSKGQCD